jgi:hypothetical protein
LLPVGRLLFKSVFEELAGVGPGMAGDVRRGAGNHDFAAAEPAFRSQVDDPVGGLDCP